MTIEHPSITQDPITFLDSFSPGFARDVQEHIQCSFGHLEKLFEEYRVDEETYNYPLLESLIRLAFHSTQPSDKDINACLMAHAPQKAPAKHSAKLPELINEAVKIIHINLHQFFHVEKHLKKCKSLCEAQKLSIKAAITQMVVRELSASIKPWLEKQPAEFLAQCLHHSTKTPEFRSGRHPSMLPSSSEADSLFAKKLEEELHAHTVALEQAIELRDVFSLLTRASILTFVKRRLNKVNLPFTPEFEDHQLPRVRHLAARNNAKIISHDYDESEINAAKVIQQHWKKLTQTPHATVPVNSISGNHSDEAHHVIALEPNLRKSVYRAGIDQFVQLMQTPDWYKHEMFTQHIDYPHYAIAAYLSGKISRPTLTMVLRFHSLKKASPGAEVFPVLASHSRTVKHVFLEFHEIISQRDQLEPVLATIPFERVKADPTAKLTITVGQAVALMLYQYFNRQARMIFTEHYNQPLPFSDSAKTLLVSKMWDPEQKSYEKKIGGVTVKPLRGYEQLSAFATQVSLLPPSEQLFYSLDSRIHFMPSVHEALQRSVYVAEDVCPVDSRLGKFSPSDIEYGERFNLRPCAMATAESFQTTRVHGSLCTQHFGESHDVAHAELMTNIPRYFRPLLFTLVDAIRSITGYHWSIESWLIVDFVHLDAFKDLTTFTPTRFFSQFFNTIMHPELLAAPQQNQSPEITALEFALVLDILFHTAKWQNLGIHTEYLQGIIQKKLGLAQHYYTALVDIPFLLAVLKLKLFHDHSTFFEIDHRVKLQKIHFKKNNENEILLYYGDICVDTKEGSKAVMRLLSTKPVTPKKQLTLFMPLVLDPKQKTATQIAEAFNYPVIVYADQQSVLERRVTQPEHIVQLCGVTSDMLSTGLSEGKSHCIFGGNLSVKKHVEAIYKIGYFASTNKKELGVGVVTAEKRLRSGLQGGFFK